MGATKKDFTEKREYQHLKEKGEIISNAEYTESILNKTKSNNSIVINDGEFDNNTLAAIGLEDIANNCNVDVKQAENITLGLKPFIEERALLIEEFKEVSKLEVTEENIKIFKTLRIKFQKNRTQGTNSWHKSAKEIPLRMGQLIDAVKRNENKINETHESFLEKAEKHYENIEKEKIAKLQDYRENLLTDLGIEIFPFGLGEMQIDVWDAYFESVKKTYLDKIEAEKQAEIKRIAEVKAEKERIEKIELENKRLEKEAKEKERIAKIEQEKRDKAEKERLEKEKIERAILLKTEVEKSRKVKKEQDILNAKLEKEREAKLKLEAEIKTKKDAELKEAKEKADKEKALLLAPDKELLEILAKGLIEYPFPKLNSIEANHILSDVKILIDEIVAHIKTKSKNL